MLLNTLFSTNIEVLKDCWSRWERWNVCFNIHCLSLKKVNFSHRTIITHLLILSKDLCKFALHTVNKNISLKIIHGYERKKERRKKKKEESRQVSFKHLTTSMPCKIPRCLFFSLKTHRWSRMISAVREILFYSLWWNLFMQIAKGEKSLIKTHLPNPAFWLSSIRYYMQKRIFSFRCHLCTFSWL